MAFMVSLPPSKGFDVIMVVVNQFNKMAHFIPTKESATTQETGRLFFTHMFKHHGFPNVATLTWPSVGVKPNTWKSWGFGVLRDSRMFRAQQQGSKHLALGCSWCHWKGLEA
jgi:hypothetical protein